MEYQAILFEVKEGYALLTFNRPDKLNSLCRQLNMEFEDAIDRVAADDSILGLVITGAGRAFAAGVDLSELSPDRKKEETKQMALKGQSLGNKLEALGKPVIAAVNGFALGGGTEIALACDIRIAGEKAVFGVPEVTLGVAPCYGGTQRLPRLVGPGIAKEMLFTGRKVKAEEALRIGLVNRVVPQEQVVEEAENLMKRIIQNGPVAVKLCKQLVDQGMQMTLADGLELEAELNGQIVETEDAREGLVAFQEKRAPVFKGK